MSIHSVFRIPASIDWNNRARAAQNMLHRGVKSSYGTLYCTSQVNFRDNAGYNQVAPSLLVDLILPNIGQPNAVRFPLSTLAASVGGQGFNFVANKQGSKLSGITTTVWAVALARLPHSCRSSVNIAPSDLGQTVRRNSTGNKRPEKRPEKDRKRTEKKTNKDREKERMELFSQLPSWLEMTI